MNIEINFYNAEAYLEKAKNKVSAQEYHTALVFIRKAYGHVRELLEQVYKLEALKDEVTEQKGD